MGRTRAALRALRRSLDRPVDRDDPDSLDPDLLSACAPMVDELCRSWFRLEVRGLDRVPEGPALLVGNHNSGTTFVEALGVGARWIVERGVADPWHGLAHDAVVDLPVLGPLMCRVGAVRAGHDAAARVFAAGRKVVVFPGGNREAFRPWRDRHRVAFHGRTGFVRLALAHGVPIVPVVYIGGHDGLVILREGRRVARWLRADQTLRTDAWPLWVGLPWGVAFGPWFHVPLPVKCVTEFLDPIPTDGYGPGAACDPAVHQDLYERVTRSIQDALDRLAAERGREGAFAGLRPEVARAGRAAARAMRRGNS